MTAEGKPSSPGWNWRLNANGIGPIRGWTIGITGSIVHTDSSDDLLYLGLRVAGPEEFAGMQHQLTAAGIKFRVGSEEDAQERRVLEVLKLTDPDGTPFDIFHGPQVSACQAVPSAALRFYR